jgi:hypothetical protein
MVFYFYFFQLLIICCLTRDFAHLFFFGKEEKATLISGLKSRRISKTAKSAEALRGRGPCGVSPRFIYKQNVKP